MSRKVLNTIVSVLIVLSGVILFNYPSISTFVNNLTANREVVDYQNATSQMNDEELEQEMRTAEAYNRSLTSSFPADPFSTGARSADLTGTGFEDFDMLQPGGAVCYLEIPRIDLYQLVRYGTDTEVLNTGIGLVENTSLPVGGTGTHAVLSAHTGMASRKLFTDLDKMQIGDMFFIHIRSNHLAYKVDQIKVVLPEETDDLLIMEDMDCVTLVTCTPFGINDHRLLVRGTRTPWDFEKEGGSPVLQRRSRMKQWIAAFTAAGVFMVIVLVFVLRDLRKNRRN